MNCMKNKLVIAGILGWLVFSSCEKELSGGFNSYLNDPRNDTIWTSQTPLNAPIFRMAEEFFPDLVVDTFDCSQGYTFVDPADSQTEIQIDPNSFQHQDGVQAVGRVRLEFFRIKTRGDHIKFFKPTHSDQYLLESGGGFFIRVTKNEQDLKLTPGSRITIRYKDAEEPKPGMEVFKANESHPPLLKGIDPMHNWLPEGNNSNRVTIWRKMYNNEMIAGYELITDRLRWVSANRFVDSTAPHTAIHAYLPPNFTNKNTLVYAVFQDHKTVVRLDPEHPSRTFKAGRIPVGSKVKLVSLSLVGANLYLGVKEFNDVGTINVGKIIPERKNLADILIYLNSL